MSNVKARSEKHKRINKKEGEGIIQTFDFSTNFKDAENIMLACRVVGSKKHEHWLNKMAAQYTRKRTDSYPCGKLCHIEIIVAVKPDTYVKISVIKKMWAGTDENGKDIWMEGGVHLKRTARAEWAKKYYFLSLSCDRGAIYRMMRCAVAQNCSGFHNVAFYTALTPIPVGLNFYHHGLLKDTTDKYFCTQLIVILLQCAALSPSGVIPTNRGDRKTWGAEAWLRRASKSNPNDLYRWLQTCDDVETAKSIGSPPTVFQSV